jgi:hypothetical protein
MIAIAFDLALGFIFGLIALAWWLVRLCVVTAYHLVVTLVSLPFRLARAVSDSLTRSSRPVAKPVWTSFDEL